MLFYSRYDKEEEVKIEIKSEPDPLVIATEPHMLDHVRQEKTTRKRLKSQADPLALNE
jgi:hypothetical protein